MMIELPNKLSLVHGPTSLQSLGNLTTQIRNELGSSFPEIWVKRDDLTGGVTCGNKLRKLEYTLNFAKQSGAEVILTCGGLQSNHCRVTAAACAKLGLKCHLILRGETSDVATGNELLDKLLGAKLSYLDKKTFQNVIDDEFEKLSQHYLDQGLKAWIIPMGASDGYGLWGYIDAYKELQEQLKGQLTDQLAGQHIEQHTEQCASSKNSAPFTFDRMFLAAGSGGTLAGLSIGFDLFNKSDDDQAFITAINVCDDPDYFYKKCSDDMQHWLGLIESSEAYSSGFKQSAQNAVMRQTQANSRNYEVSDGYKGKGYAMFDEVTARTINRLAQSEGIILDPVYTGKAFTGMLDLLEREYADLDRVLFWHTGGIHGLYAFDKELSQLKN